MEKWPDHLAGQIYVSAGLLSGGHFGSPQRVSPIFCLGRGISKARTRGSKFVPHLLVCTLLLTPVMINRTT